MEICINLDDDRKVRDSKDTASLVTKNITREDEIEAFIPISVFLINLDNKKCCCFIYKNEITK